MVQRPQRKPLHCCISRSGGGGAPAAGHSHSFSASRNDTGAGPQAALAGVTPSMDTSMPTFQNAAVSDVQWWKHAVLKTMEPAAACAGVGSDEMTPAMLTAKASAYCSCAGCHFAGV